MLTSVSVVGWFGITLLLCAFGLLREIRPSEPFVTEFLVGEWRNITQEQVYQDVYPIGTYCYLGLLVFVFLLTDYLRFKPVIVISGISGILIYAILLWTSSVEWLQVSQFAYGLYMATEVAYYTYIFTKVDANKYGHVSSYTRMAALIGRFVSGMSADLLTRFGVMDYRQLNYITFTAQILATFWAVILPSVDHSVYFHRKVENDSCQSIHHKNSKQSWRSRTVEAFGLIAGHARGAYARGTVVRWSLLYATSLCLYVQAQNYVQFLWIDIQGEHREFAYNGLVEATLTLGGAGGAWLTSVAAPAHVPAPLAAAQALALFLAAYLDEIYVSYVSYVFVGIAYHYVITLASTRIARELSDNSCFGLIFGINTLAGAALQSVFTAVAVTELALHIRLQFYTLAVGYLLLSVAWTAASIRKTSKFEL